MSDTRPNHNLQKKIAVINDFSGFGRCSIAVALPIISAMRIQCCPLPTSIFSNHTGFESFFFEDYTSRMQPYIEEWKKLGLQFSGISTGFLGSKEQIQIVLQFFKDFGTEDNVIVVDPVMGDYGKTYSTYTPEMCEEMKKLVSYADILTPNLTEACILTDTPYHEKWSMKEVGALAEKLSGMGPEKVVITGIIQGEFIANYCYEKDQPGKIRRTHKVGTQRSGTGDIFAAIIAADAVNGVPFQDSVRKASLFIKKCIEKSIEMDLPLTDGVCFEEVLHKLQ
ncbi:MAG: pyridoxamine kinase [Candidatus Choladocola sp.]|nr:pyridoxamine kinase [Candidatus Choladocola sp.]